MNRNDIKQQGFTIVELLIVIVVIAILAAITIVAYNGVQNRAKTTSAQSAANSVIKKAELYNTEKSYYPSKISALTGAAQTDTYLLTGVFTSDTSLDLSAAPSTPNTVAYRACIAGSTPLNQAAIGATAATGGIVTYWDYGVPAKATKTVGNVGNGTTACPTT